MRGALPARLSVAFAFAFALVAAPVRAQSCESGRPTEASGASGISYGAGAVVESFESASGRARVFFAAAGVHAPTSMLAVTSAAEAADRALAEYDELGYRAVVSDADSPCADNGGSGQIDIYLVDFRAADGQVVLDHCAQEGGARRCAGFILVENDFRGGGYADVVEGMQTVVPHEMFHLVQDAYDADIDRFWAEGSAQWAAKLVYPETRDLERFLPTYFANPVRPLDGAAGVASSFLYATAVWPVYLSERFGSDLIRRIFERSGGGEKVFAATDAELVAAGSGLGAEFLQFAAFNAATGARAREGAGYAHAADYPEVVPTAFTAEVGEEIAGVGSGLAAEYYELRIAARRRLTFEADPARVRAVFLPFDGDTARLDLQQPLPAVVDGDGILVIAGQSASKVDAPFRVVVESPDGSGAKLHESSCSVARGFGQKHDDATAVVAIASLGLLGARRRRRSSAR